MSRMYPSDEDLEREQSRRSGGRSEKLKKAATDIFRDAVAIYDYTDERGVLLYQVARDAQKNFAQRRPNVGRDPKEPEWIYETKGVRRVLYGLPEVRFAIARGHSIYVVEGEKDARNLLMMGVTATTAAMGAKAPWLREYTEQLSGATDVVVIPDNDQPGREHAVDVAEPLSGKVGRVRVLTLPLQREGGDVSDWIEAGGTRGDLEALASNCPDYIPSPERLLRISVGGWDLLNKEIPEPRSIIGSGVFTEGDLGFLIGEGGAGKSQIAVQLAVGRALAGEWIGFEVEHGRTGLLMLELDDWTWKQRIRAVAGDAASEALNAIRIVCRPDLSGILDLANDRDMRALATWIRGEGLTMVVLDPLSRVHGLDENKADQMGGLLQRLDALRVDTKCAILVNHHSRKSKPGEQDSDADAGSGSRVFRDFPSFHARLVKKSEEIRVLKFGKVSRAAEPSPIWLRKRPENGSLEVTDAPEAVKNKNIEKVRDSLRQAGPNGLTVAAIVEDTRLSKSTVHDHLKALGAESSGGRAPRYRLPSEPSELGRSDAETQRDGNGLDDSKSPASESEPNPPSGVRTVRPKGRTGRTDARTDSGPPDDQTNFPFHTTDPAP